VTDDLVYYNTDLNMAVKKFYSAERLLFTSKMTSLSKEKFFSEGAKDLLDEVLRAAEPEVEVEPEGQAEPKGFDDDAADEGMSAFPSFFPIRIASFKIESLLLSTRNGIL